MAYWLLEYDLCDDYLERRGPLRQEHLGLLQGALERGEVVLAGALADPVDRAVLVWRSDDTTVVEAFVKQDPYVREGLVVSSSIRPWTVVIDGTLPA